MRNQIGHFTLRIILLLSLQLGPGHIFAQKMAWPQFHGKDCSGVAGINSKLPIELNNNTMLWKTACPIGHSSPVIWEDRLFLTGFIKNPGTLQTICINRTTGRIEWTKGVNPEKLEKYHAVSNAAASTPVTDGKRVYVYFGSYGLLCYDLEGRLIWDYSMPLPEILYGTATSPIVSRDFLLLSHDVQNDSYLLALDKSSGEPVWKVMLPDVSNAHNKSGYSTPVLFNDQVILHRVWEISAYSVKDGCRIWNFPTPSSGVSTPIFHEQTIYAGTWQVFGEKDRVGDLPDFATLTSMHDTNGDGLISKTEIPDDMLLMSRPELEDNSVYFKSIFGMIDKNGDGLIDQIEWKNIIEWLNSVFKDSGLIAFQPDGHGELPLSQLKWKVTGKVPEVPSPVYYKGCVYMCKNGGILTCVDAKNGNVFYQERIDAKGPYYASPVAADNQIYISSGKGIITVIKADRKIDILARNDLKEGIFASPAIAGNTIYIRTTEHLYAFSGEDND